VCGSDSIGTYNKTPISFRKWCKKCGGHLFTSHPTIVQILRYGNPVSPPISAIRDPLWAGTPPRTVDVVYLVCAAVVALAIGAATFRHYDDRIAVEL